MKATVSFIYNVIKTILGVLEKLFSINPNHHFITITASFVVAIFAFLIPLSISIISKVSERYGSDVLSGFFKQKWFNKIAKYFLAFNIFLIILLQFIEKSIPVLYLKIIDWFILILSFFILYITIKVIDEIIKIISDTRYVMYELAKYIEKIIEK